LRSKHPAEVRDLNQSGIYLKGVDGIWGSSADNQAKAAYQNDRSLTLG
jgi:hypothetical protein